MKKVLGSCFDPSLCTKERRVGPKGEHIYGATVARISYYRNMVKYGTFDEYHFFIRSEKFEEDKKATLLFFSDERVLVRDMLELIPAFENTRFTVFLHTDPAIGDLVYLRNYYAKKQFPICGLTNTISYPGMVKEAFADNILSGMQPYDSLICISKAVLRSVKKIHALIKSEMAAQVRPHDALKYTGRLDFLPLGIECDNYNKCDKQTARKRLKLPLDRIIILFFGRFSIKDKADLTPLLYALEELVVKYPHKKIVLLLAGNAKMDTGYVQLLMLMVKKMGLSAYVTFLVDNSMSEQSLIYAASDIFVSPVDNLQESFGFTPIEAMASGLPAVVSDWDGYRDTVIHGTTGFLIPTLWAECDRLISARTHLPSDFILDSQLYLAQSICVDIAKMVEYLSLLIEKEDLRLQLGAHARERALRVYDWKVLIPLYEKLWEELSSVARTHTKKRVKRSFYPGFFKCFNHFSSALLRDSTKVAISSRGREILKKGAFAWQIGYIDKLFTSNSVKPMLLFVKRGKVVSVAELKHAFRGMDRQAVVYHIMWMLKHYLLAVK